jgi:large subunit ribosomal protein L32
MAPLPKQKVTKAKGRMRRSHNALIKPNLAQCPQCGEKRLPHHACPKCGTYQDVQTKKVEAKKTTK